MPSPKGDPTYIKDKEKYFMSVAKTVALASTHPKSPGGCIIVRDREIIGDGRSIYTASNVEIDPITYAIAATSKRGTPTTGANVYSTRYPFSSSVFQCYVMGIRKIIVLAHDWEPYYKDEFRRAARLARELSIAIEPLFEDDDQRFNSKRFSSRDASGTHDEDLYTDPNHFTPDDFDPQDAKEIQDEDTTTI